MTIDPSRLKTVSEALSRISSDLAGLLAKAVELLGRLHEPGAVYLLAHAGREISTTVVHALADQPIPISDAQLEDLENQREVFRRTIASALDLDIDHPLVKQWFALHAVFVSNAHVPRPFKSRDSGQVADAFAEFVEFLYARLAAYFEAQRELERLLNVPDPSTQQIDQARQLLVRPALRRFFFGRLSQAAWLEPLVRNGLMSRPLDWSPESGSQIRYTWPEGEYLLRMARLGTQSKQVATALTQIPETNRNPLVWGIAADASLHLDVSDAKPFVSRFLQVLDGPVPFLYAATLAKLAVRFAQSGERKAAFRLANKLLSVTPRQDPATITEDDAWIRQEPVLQYFASHDLDTVFRTLVPGLAQHDPESTLKLLIRVIMSAAFAAGSTSEGQHDGSEVWGMDLVPAGMIHSVKEGLATSTTSVALEIARHGPDEARRVVQLLSEKSHVAILRRILIRVVTEVGQHVQPHLDSLLTNERMFDHYYYRTEYDELLRTQFGNASETARERHIALIREGLPREDVAAHLRFLGRPETDDNIDGVIAGWQVRMIERLGEPVPAALQELLDRQRARLASSAEPMAPELAEPAQETNGVGTLAVAAPSEIPALLHTMSATMAGDEPLEQKVASVLVDRAQGDPEIRALLQSVQWTDLPIRWLVAVVKGSRDALTSGAPVDRTHLLVLAEWLLIAQPDDFALKSESVAALLQEAKTTLIELLAESARSDKLDGDTAGRAVALLLSLPETFGDEPIEHPQDAMGYPRGFASQIIRGQVARAAIELGLFLVRRNSEGSDVPDPAAITRILDVSLHRTDSAGLATRIMVASYLPWVLLIDSEWMRSRVPFLFPGTFARGNEDPAWRAYLRNALYVSAFNLLRPAYSEAARCLMQEADLEGEEDERATATGHLVSHVVWAFLRGAVRPGDPDGLLEQVFTNAPIGALQGAFWEVFRAVAAAGKAEQQIDPQLHDRLYELWEWRLAELESHADKARAKSEARALAWFFQIRQLDAVRALSLMQRTIAISQGAAVYSPLERIAAIAGSAPAVAIAILDEYVKGQPGSEHLRFEEEELRVILRIGMRDGATRVRTAALINTLGERGLDSLRDVLDGAAGPSSDGISDPASPA